MISKDNNSEEVIKADLTKFNTPNEKLLDLNASFIDSSNKEAKKKYFPVFGVKIVIIISLVVFMYGIQGINSLLKDQLDMWMSLYPRDWTRIWTIFTCTFIHNNFTHLNSIIVLFAVCSFFVILRGNLRFVWLSIIVIVFGNCCSWIFGSYRMNGISGWIFGLLGYIYFSVITDVGYPIRCTKNGMKTLALALAVTALLIIIWHLDFVSFSTACWQYNVSGIIGGIIAACLFTSQKLVVKLGIANDIIDTKPQPSPAPPIDATTFFGTPSPIPYIAPETSKVC